MKIREWLLNKFFSPLIVAVIASLIIGAIIGAGSKISTGYWKQWFTLIPHIAWIVLVVLGFVWVTIIAIRNRRRQVEKLRVAQPMRLVCYDALSKIEDFEYCGVVWSVLAPKPGTYGSPKPSPSNIELKIPPRCPKCGTELEESPSFWGGYIWKCVRCGFHKRNKDRFYQEQARAQKIVRRNWENQPQ